MACGVLTTGGVPQHYRAAGALGSLQQLHSTMKTSFDSLKNSAVAFDNEDFFRLAEEQCGQHVPGSFKERGFQER